MTGADLGSVLVEGDITDIVRAVFNGPVSSVAGEEVLRRSSFRRKAGNAVSNFGGGFACLDVQDVSPYCEKLLDVRQRDIFDKTSGSPNGACFQTAMSLFDGLELDWSLLELQVCDGIHHRGLIVLDREEEIRFFLFNNEFYSFF